MPARHHTRFVRAALATLLLVCLAGPALADDGEPEVAITADGTIEGTVTVGAPPDVVRTYLADIAMTRKLAKDVVSVDVVKDGGCELVTTYASSFIDVTYLARRCPTETGWIETLLASEQFADYYAEWFVTPVRNGIELRFRLRTDLDMPVPVRLVRGALKRSVKGTLIAIQGDLGGPHDPPSRVAEP
jgi:hypothetical protein